jgi:PAS domain S-box-containing protein
VGSSLAAEPLLALAVNVTSEQHVDAVLRGIVRGLATQPGVALARIWLVSSADLPSDCRSESAPGEHLCLVASAGTPMTSPGEDWSFLQGHFARVPFNVGKVGQVAASRVPILVEDVTTQSDWIVRPEWAKREEIRSFAGHPLIFRNKLLGVIAVFSRQPYGQQEFTWLGLFANQAALAISNASAEQALQSSDRNLAAIIDAIPTVAWCNLPDGSNEFLNKGWHEYTGLTPEESHGWGWQVAFHPEDLPSLMDKWRKMLVTGEPDEVEARLRRHDGVYRWFLIRAQALRNDSGKIVRWYGTSTDIEDRKQAEETLRLSELDARSLLDNMPGLLARLSPDGTPEFFNRQFLHYLGKTEEEIQKWKANDIVHPDDRAHTIELLGNAISTGQPFDFEYRLRRFDGAYRWFQARGVSVRNGEGQILHWNVLVTDIDDRKEAEEALESSERNLRLTINAIPTAIGVMRADGTPLYGNQAVTDYTGLTTEDLLKADFRNRLFHPEDLERFREARSLAFSRPVPFESEQRALGKDGKYRWFLFRYKPVLDQAGRIDRWYMAAFDIDDRKRAEAQVEQAYLRLAEAQRLSKTGSFITDLVVDEHNWSEETFRIFDFDPSSNVTVQRIRDVIHPEDLPSFDAMIARAMTGVNVDFVFRIVTSRNAMKHIRGMARVMVQNPDRPLFIGALQDITESKVAEEALDRARSELAHVARLTTMNALTASIAHEINQPLASLVTNASISLRRLNADPPNLDGARETVQRTIRDANRASDVVTRLRAMFSKKEFMLETLDLNQATEEVIALLLSDLQRNRVILRSELAGDLPPIIGDRVQLQQVTLNLIRNASDAMTRVEDRPRQLLVKTRRDGDDHVRLSVQDAGCGVNPRDFEKLFEAFFTTKSGGMGIGLSVSRSIIERHQGRLWAESNDGPGTTFSFSIPRAQNSARDEAAQWD